MKTLILVVCSIVLFACANDESASVPTDSSTAARAYDRTLTWAEVAAVIPDASTPEDSAILAERYINDWLKEQVLLHTAEQRLPDDQKQFEAELEAQRKALLTFAYENLFVQQRLDTLISDDEIQAFYDENLSIFSLNDYIVKVKFAVLAKDTPKAKLKQFRKLFESEDPEDLVALEQFCVNNGAAYYIDIETWMYFEELLTKVPIDVYNVESFLRSTRSAEFEEGGKSYYLKLLAYELKDAVSPLPLVTNNIKSMILNRRKRDLLVKMRDDLFNDAYARKDVEKLY